MDEEPGMSTSCWFCESQTDLRVFERESDSAPYLEDDGSPQMICSECVEDMRRYRDELHRQTLRRGPEYEQRKRDAKAGW